MKTIKLRAIALTLALALVAAFCGCFMAACNNSGGNGGNGENDGSGTSKDTISLEVASVSTGDDDLSTYVINASVNVQLTPRWAITWENADSEWASGKNVSDYLKLDLSNGNLTATITWLQAFGETAVLTATIGQGSLAVSESKKIDYSLVDTYELSSDGTYYIAKRAKNVDLYSVCIFSEYKGLPVKEIAYGCFTGCSKNTSLIIPDSITSLPVYAFASNSSLKEIVLSKNLTSIPRSAFSNCSSLEDFIIPDWITSIDKDAFCYCTSLKTITVPESVTSIGYHAFDHCHSLTNVIFLGDKSKINIDPYAFENCPYRL